MICSRFTTIKPYSYTILAPTVLPKGFVDAKEASCKVVKEIALDENDYRFGHTKVPIIVPLSITIPIDFFGMISFFIISIIIPLTPFPFTLNHELTLTPHKLTNWILVTCTLLELELFCESQLKRYNREFFFANSLFNWHPNPEYN